MLAREFYTGYLVPALIVSALAGLAYSDLQDHSYLFWDDYKYLFNNPYYHNIGLNTFISFFTDFSQVNWHPITSISFLLDFYFWPKNAMYFKAVNITIHIANSIIVYFLSLKVFSYVNLHRQQTNVAPHPARLVVLFSFFTSLIFAIHPQHTESVIWIIERKDTLCAFFYFSAILSYFKQLESNNEKIWRNYTAILFVLALMSKSMAVTLPVTLIVIDIFLIKKTSHIRVSKDYLASLISNKIILFATSLAFSILTIFTQRETIEENIEYGFFARLVNASAALYHHIGSALFPYELSPYYPISSHSINMNFTGILLVFSVAFALFLLTLINKKKSPYPLGCFIYLIVTIAPVIGLIKIGHAGFADRYMYIPSLSIYLMMGYFMGNIVTTKKNQVLKYINSIFVLSFVGYLCYTTFDYTHYWKNDDLLWHRVINLYPNESVTPYHNLGSIYALRNEFEKSIKYYKKALELNPKYFNTIYNLARVYQRTGNEQLSAQYYKHLTETNPKLVKSHVIYGDYLLANNQHALAEQSYNKALNIDPTNLVAIYKTALMDVINKRYQLADKKLALVLLADNDNIEALHLLANLKIATGNLSEAETVSKLILRLFPKDTVAQAVLASISNRTEPKAP